MKIAKNFNFSAPEIKEAYSKNVDTYMQPEKRTAIVAAGKTLEEATALQQALDKKASLLTDKALTLTNISEREVQPPLGTAIFAALRGKSLNPYK